MKAKEKLDGIGGMTVNELLFAGGLMDLFEKKLKTDKKSAEYILKSLNVDNDSIQKIFK